MKKKVSKLNPEKLNNKMCIKHSQIVFYYSLIEYFVIEINSYILKERKIKRNIRRMNLRKLILLLEELDSNNFIFDSVDYPGIHWLINKRNYYCHNIGKEIITHNKSKDEIIAEMEKAINDAKPIYDRLYEVYLDVNGTFHPKARTVVGD